MDTDWKPEDTDAWDDGVRFGALRETEYPYVNSRLDIGALGTGYPVIDQFIETAREYITLLEQRVDLLSEIIANQKRGE